jgi:Raf kinase inhibitor-like YbhB/YbcL family protein
MFRKIMFSLTFVMLAGAASAFSIWSPDLQDGFSNEQVYNGFGCEGENVSPELMWKDAPENAKSFVLMVYDPDAPTGSGWWHWVVTDIPAKVTRISKGASTKGMPDGSIQVETDYGKPGYGGPCPPSGPAHRYIFTLYAMPIESVGATITTAPAMIGFMVNSGNIAKASFTTKYGR